ncbi:MAG: tRNA/rRNA methyltransferase SpoU [Candidatus Paceibacter sp.]|nr:tRNA/rRNA methyltransferase SpoU [Candidatus Paceibacter sp.]
MLHNIRSLHNVGSMFRTADAAGVTKIFLTGYTPTPIDRFGRPVKELSKVALGGELSVQWEYVKSPMTVINKLKKQGVQVIGLEQDKRSVDYKKVKPKGDVLFLVGSEVEGMSKALLNKCDIIAEIPMKGKKESLNVSVSFGIALFRLLNI